MHSDAGVEEEAPMATEYLVFYFTAYDAGPFLKFIAARYALSAITAQFPVDVVPSLPVALDGYSFVVTSIVADAANENKSGLGVLCDIPAAIRLFRAWC